MSATLLPSVCPHDCPSVCALEVERLDGGRLGKVRGSQRNPYTAGVICAKVARYAERFNHPDRLAQPLRRIGPKGSGAFAPVAWDDALDEVAEAFVRKVQQHGAQTVWPYFYAGHHGPGAARRHQPPAPRHALFGLAHHDLRDPVRHRLARRLRPALGRDRRGDGAFGPDRDLGHQPREHPGQRHDPRGAGEKGARRPPGRGRPVSDGHGGAGGRASGPAARHRRRARLRRDARAVPRRPCRSRLPRQVRRRLARARGASAHPDAGVGGAHHRAAGRRDRGVRPPLRLDPALVPASRLRLHAHAQRRRQHARGVLPAGGQRRLAVRGRRRAVQPGRPVPLGQDQHRRARCARPGDPPARSVAHRADPGRRPPGHRRRPAGHGAADPEHQSDVRRARARQGARGLRPRGSVRVRARAVHDRDRAGWRTSCCRPPSSSSTTTSTRPPGTRASRSRASCSSRMPTAGPTIT